MKAGRIVVGWVAWIACAALLTSTGWAADANPGQEDLDKATTAKLTATSVGQLDAVITLCESAKKKGLDKDNTTFADQMLSATLTQRGLLRARALFENPATIDPTWPQVAALRQQAQGDLERAVQIDPNQPEAQLYLARLLCLPHGDRKRALQCLDKAVEATAENPPLRAKALVIRAELCGDPKKCLADLDAAVQLTPNDANVVYRRGLMYINDDKLDKGLADLDRTLQLEPDYAPAYEAKALVLMRQEKFDAALVALDKARELDRNAVFPLLQQARIHVLQKNGDAAVHDLGLALDRRPNNLDVLLMRAEVLMDLGRLDQAQADVDAALANQADYPPAIRLRATLLAAGNKMDEAIRLIEGLRDKQPKDIATQLQLAMLYAAVHQNDKALAAYDAILKADAKNFLALRSKGDVLLGTGRHAQALECFNRACELDPEDSSLLNNLAWLLATSPDDKLRDGKRAVQLATAACKRTDYKQAHILSTLAAAYAETGDFAAATQCAQKALAAGDETLKDELQKELKRYQEHQPTRERLTGDEPKKSAAKPAAPPAAGGEKPSGKAVKID